MPVQTNFAPSRIATRRPKMRSFLFLRRKKTVPINELSNRSVSQTDDESRGLSPCKRRYFSEIAHTRFTTKPTESDSTITILPTRTRLRLITATKSSWHSVGDILLPTTRITLITGQYWHYHIYRRRIRRLDALCLNVLCRPKHLCENIQQVHECRASGLAGLLLTF